MEHGQIAPGTWIRRSRRNGFFAAFAAAWSLVMLLVPLVYQGSGAAGVFLFGVLFALPGLALARRIATAGLWLGPDRIVVRGPVRTRSIPLAAAGSFSAGVVQAVGNGTPCPILTLRDGPPVGIWALGREGVVWRFKRYVDELQPLCEELNRLLDSLRAGGGAAAPATQPPPAG